MPIPGRRDPARPRYVVLAGSFGAYRRVPLALVRATLGDDVLLVGGDRPVSPGVALLDPADVAYDRVPVRFLRGDLIVQRVPWRTVVAAERVVADLNPRNLTVWAVLLVRRMLRRPTVLWGHAWSSGGRGSRGDRLRGAMRRLADGLLAYGYRQQQELRAAYPDLFVGVAPNALVPADEMTFDQGADRVDVVQVGRLTAAKKPALLLAAFASVVDALPGRLVFVGDGPLRDELAAEARRRGLADRVELLGHVEDTAALRRIYARAITSVSAGYAGLSVTQSLGFGVPCVVARDEPHSPEIEAVEDGVNAVLVPSDDPAAMGAALRAAVHDADRWRAAGPAIAAACRSRWSAEVMAAGIVAALRGAA